jgi:hypothetical protein
MNKNWMKKKTQQQLFKKLSRWWYLLENLWVRVRTHRMKICEIGNPANENENPAVEVQIVGTQRMKTSSRMRTQRMKTQLKWKKERNGSYEKEQYRMSLKTIVNRMRRIWIGKRNRMSLNEIRKWILGKLRLSDWW